MAHRFSEAEVDENHLNPHDIINAKKVMTSNWHETNMYSVILETGNCTINLI